MPYRPFQSARRLVALVLLATALPAMDLQPVLAQESGIVAAQVRRVLANQFERPGHPLTVEPVAAAGDFALAGWRQEASGGRALLRRTHGRWTVLLCGGDGLRDAARLHRAGVPSTDATRLLADLAQAERTLDPAIRDLFSRFQGEVVIGAGDAHPHVPPAC